MTTTRTPVRVVEITRAAGGGRVISGSTVEQGDAPTGGAG
jgi:hypothetical protein